MNTKNKELVIAYSVQDALQIINHKTSIIACDVRDKVYDLDYIKESTIDIIKTCNNLLDFLDSINACSDQAIDSLHKILSK